MLSYKNKPLCITLGDPSGVGPEITAKALNFLNKKKITIHFIVIGSKIAFNKAWADSPEPKITTGIALSSFWYGYKKYFATSLEIFMKAYNTEDKSNPCRIIIERISVSMRSNCNI